MSQTVVHVSDSHLFGGTEQAILQLLEGLDRRHWRCVLLHQPMSGHSPLVEGARSLGVEHRESETLPGLRGLTLVPRLVRQLRSIRPAVVHAHLTSPLACESTLLAAAGARVPAVVATSQLFLKVLRGWPTARHRLIASTVDRYIAVSRGVARNLREELSVPARKIRMVHNAVALERFVGPTSDGTRDELTGGTSAPVALTVARLHQQKGHRFLLEAAVHIPDAVFVLAGDGPERQSLEREARVLGVSDRVRFLGHRTDIPGLLMSCDVLVLPSLCEGLPLVVLEAMAAGKPVVATSILGTNEAVVDGETGFLVAPSNSAALAAAIQRVIQDDGLARRLGANGRVRAAARFSLQSMVQQVAGVYDEVLA